MCSDTESCLTLCDPRNCSLIRLLCPWDSPGRNTVVGCHFLLQEIFLTQGSNPRFLHWQADSLPLSHLGSLTGNLHSHRMGPHQNLICMSSLKTPGTQQEDMKRFVIYRMQLSGKRIAGFPSMFKNGMKERRKETTLGF